MSTAFANSALLHAPRAEHAPVSRPTVGLLTDSFSYDYQLSILAGAVRAARDRQANLIAFACGVPQSPHPEETLPSSENIDGLVVSASTMMYALGTEGLTEYCRSLGALPTCFIGARSPLFPAVVAENRGGIELAVRHLIRAHDKRRIAFLGGIPGNPEAEERLDAFRNTLRAHRIEPDEALITVGDFMRHPGEQAMRRLLAQGLRPDAVVAANDMMAFGAIDALREVGLEVPRDVAVIGFDDTEEGHFSTPTLTSVRQPLVQFGAEATHHVLDALADGEPASEVGIRLSLMQRASCGCSRGSGSFEVAPAQVIDSEFEAAFQRRRLLILAELSRAGQSTFGRGSMSWPERVLDAYADDVSTARMGGFLATLRTELARTRAAGAEIAIWQRIVGILHDQALPCVPVSDPRRPRAEGLLHRALEEIGREMQDTQAMRRLSLERWMRALRLTGSSLHRAPTTDELLPLLVEHLELLGFARAYVALRETSTTSRLLLGYDRSLPLSSHRPCPLFTTSELAPWALRDTSEPRTWIVIPLQLGGPVFGHVMLDYGAGEGLLWEGFSEQLAVALGLCHLTATAR